MQHLFSEFGPVTATEWKAQLAKDLKGETFESLGWENENGFTIHPFYTSEDLQQAYEPAFTHASWEIGVSAKGHDAKLINQQLLRDLNAGAGAIALHCEGLDLGTALRDVQLNYIHSSFHVSAGGLPELGNFLEKNYTPGTLHCALLPENFTSGQQLESWIKSASAFDRHAHVRTYGFDALFFHNQSCLAYYEIALILAALKEYLEILPKQVSGSKFVIRTGVSSDYFIQMAKLRAIRRLWKLVAGEYEIKGDLYIIAETSSTNKSISDKYNNLLRTSVEAMAAVSGGCNELIVTGFDSLFPKQEARGERLAVNQQLILKEESYFDKVADVACGAYYVEKITDHLADRALETLKHFEGQGGYFSCLQSGLFEKEIAVQAKQREALVNEHKQIVIGVNKFHNDNEHTGLNAGDIEQLRRLPIHNPVLKFELDHYLKGNA